MSEEEGKSYNVHGLVNMQKTCDVSMNKGRGKPVESSQHENSLSPLGLKSVLTVPSMCIQRGTALSSLSRQSGPQNPSFHSSMLL